MFHRVLMCLLVCFFSFQVLNVNAQDAVQLEGKPKVAFIYDGPANDGGWSQSVDEARQRLEKELNITITHIENVPSTDATKTSAVLQRLISRGYNVIVGSAFGYSDPFKTAAQQNPHVAFIDIGGKNQYANLGTLYGRTYESQYLCGMAAAAASKTAKLGFVASNPIGPVVWSINAYLLGARQINSKATVTAIYTGSWNDPVKERATASALIDQGIDVIGQNTDTFTPQIVAQERGVFGTGMDRDFRQYAPKATVCSVVNVWDRYLSQQLKSIFANQWKPNLQGDFKGISEGGTDIACCSHISEANTKKIETARQDIINGKSIFVGPLVDRDGKTRVEKNVKLTDEQLWKMNWYVDGVITQRN